VAVARSYSGGIALPYVFPVLWMTSRLAAVGRMSARAFRLAKYSARGGAENAGVENAGVEKAGGITYGKPSEQKTLMIPGV